MLYQFPTPEWFDAGTTSQLLLRFGLWSIIVGMIGSVWGCWLYLPRSRTVWIAAETFWVTALLPLALCFIPSLFPPWLKSAPPFLAVGALFVLVLLPIPAAIAGYIELRRGDNKPSSFRDNLYEGCTISFCGFIALFFVPTFGVAGEATRRAQCKNNLRQIGLALENINEQHGEFPDSQIRKGDSPAHSWRVEILPYLDRRPDFEAYDHTTPWDSAQNLPMAQKYQMAYDCPSIPRRLTAARRDQLGRQFTAYATLNGPDAAFQNGNGRPLSDFSDGASNTAIVAEACGQQIVWTEPRDIELTDESLGINLPGHKSGQSIGSWSSYHRGGAHTLLADGSVRFLSVATDPRVLRAITTATGGEDVGNF